MAVGSVGAAVAADQASGGRIRAEIWLGLLAPLVVVIGTWTLVERMYRRQPERLTAMLMKAFAGKLVFFGAYVGLAIGVLQVQPIPFIVSFTTCFIALHLIEALCMKRLFVS